jgi:hypothetical protein
MNETCDRCGPAVAAVYRGKRHGELYLCGHCTNRLRAALFAQGWTIGPAGGHAPAPQVNECPGRLVAAHPARAWVRPKSPDTEAPLPAPSRAGAGVLARAIAAPWPSAANPRKQS